MSVLVQLSGSAHGSHLEKQADAGFILTHTVIIAEAEERQWHWDAQVAQSLKQPALGFGSGHDLGRETKPQGGLQAERGACLGLSLSPSPSAFHPLSLSLSS